MTLSNLERRQKKIQLLINFKYKEEPERGVTKSIKTEINFFKNAMPKIYEKNNKKNTKKKN